MNEVKRPRILFDKFADKYYEELKQLAGTSHLLQEFETIHPSDWDLVVTGSAQVEEYDRSLHVLSFGASSGGRVETDIDRTARFSKSPWTQARQAYVASTVKGRLKTLIERTIIQQMSNAPQSRQTWVLGKRFPSGGVISIEDTGDLQGTCKPLVHIGKEKYVYGLEFLRSFEEDEHRSLCWLLPQETTGHADWLRYVLDALQEYDPGRFPVDAEWKSSKEWAVPSLSNALGEIDDLDEAWESAEAQYRTKRTQLLAEVEELTAAAADREWKLLTEDGEALVQAVGEVLRTFGFEVQDMDEHHRDKVGARLEDLQVSVIGQEAWVCLAEVKGYTNGVKVSGVSQVSGRPVAHYIFEHQAYPDSVWLIVNSFRNDSPESRPQAIPNSADLEPLTQANGALIDTRDLFRAWKDVESGTARPDEVRDSLMKAVTRWEWYERN